MLGLADIDDIVQGAGAGGDRAARRRRGAGIDEHGMMAPPAMENYREHDIMWGFAKLKKYDRIDLFWGHFKNVERDLIRAHFFMGGLMMIILVYIIVSSINDKQKNAGNI